MRRLLAVLVALAVSGIVLGAAQLVLPGLAAQRVRDELARNGQVADVQVSAFPAIELLWHRADSITVTLRSYRASQQTLSRLLRQGESIGRLTVRSALFTDGLLRVHDAKVRKLGNRLTAEAQVDESDVRAATLGLLQSVTPLETASGQLVLSGVLSSLGMTVHALLSVQHGDLVLGLGLPLLPNLTLFRDPRVYLENVRAEVAPGGFMVRLRGRVR